MVGLEEEDHEIVVEERIVMVEVPVNTGSVFAAAVVVVKARTDWQVEVPTGTMKLVVEEELVVEMLLEGAQRR